MTEPSERKSLASSGLYSAFAGVVLLMWMCIGVIGGVIVCGVVDFNDSFPIDEAAGDRVSEYTYAGILFGGIALGCVGYWAHRPRPDQEARSLDAIKGLQMLLVTAACMVGVFLGGWLGVELGLLVDDLMSEPDLPPFHGFGLFVMIVICSALSGAVFAGVVTWRYFLRPRASGRLPN
jgi:hypothetical protein